MNMENKKLNLGIIGPGKIAATIAKALDNIKGINKYSVASRSIERAQEFKNNFGFIKAYGSYKEMLEDDNVDLVYIATPHSFHYQNMLMCIEHKKNIICEKAFCLNEKQASEVIKKAKENNVFICEALCTAFLPSVKILNDLLESNIIGEVTSSYSVFGANLLGVERVIKKELGGGALLDIGIYPLFFTLNTFGFNCVIEDVKMKMYNDVDESEIVTLSYPNKVKCIIEASIRDNLGMYSDIFGTKGKIHIENIGRPEFIDVYDNDNNLIKHIDNLRNTSGYEYEFISCMNAINSDKLETDEMTHDKTLKLLEFMDKIRSI